LIKTEKHGEHAMKNIILSVFLTTFALSACSIFRCPCEDIKENMPPAVSAGDLAKYCAESINSTDVQKGETIPDALIPLIKKMMKLPDDVSSDYIRQTSFWRCMDGNVYVCMTGANLPCTEKANASKIPDAAMADYCRENPDDAFIPAYITGRATIYDWSCEKGKPLATRQLFKPDKQGFISEIWFELESDNK